TLGRIKELGAQAAVALNPSTPPEQVEHVLDLCDMVLVMTVNPGFGGQAFLESMVDKVQQARAMIDRAGVDVELQVDGGVAPATAPLVRKAGATVLVAGSAIFKADEPFAERIAKLRGDA
ncbi:MAG: ribulose-phosphate 3-epimerase, partial [Candidatus Thermoplasmatota archaeon]|nr:ribulose-phosphate 3-epimerase [Candidatus Thermoplasmatota archaeon]